MNRPKVLILDFDGVVIESNDIKTDAFLHVFSHFPEFKDEMMAYHFENISQNRFSKFDHLLSLMKRQNDQELKNQLAENFSLYIGKEMLSVSMVPGAIQLLQLFTTSIPVYLASVTPEKELFQILQQRDLVKYFKGVYGCPPWNKPDAILDILVKEEVEPEYALMIGDSAGDQRAALSTGICFLARDSGLSFDTPLPFTFKDLNEISNYLSTKFYE